MEIKETTKRDGKLNNVQVVNGLLTSEEGEVIDLIPMLETAFGDQPFNLSVSAKTESIICE